MQDISTFIANHMALTYALASVLVALMILEFIRLKKQAGRVDPARAVQLINRENAAVIDVRAADLFKSGHIIDALSFPANAVLDNTKKIERFRGKPLIIVCSAGIESQKIASTLIKQGYNAYSLAGGMRAWSAAEMPVVKD